MKGTPAEAQQMGKAPLHEHKPLPEPKTLSEKLAWLSIQRHQASLWWAAEVKKLVPVALALEAEKWRMAWQGLLVGIVIGLALAWYLGFL
mgnify:CR=1 FL=1